MTAQPHEKISVREKLGYGAGDLASGLYLQFYGVFLFYFFVELKGLSPAAMSVMLLLLKMVDAVTDPVMGAIADRTRTRWGRYRPYLLFGAVPFAFFSVLVFAAPQMDAVRLLIWAYVTYTLSKLAFTAVNVPYSGLLGVISPSSAQRGSVTAYRMLFSSLATILVAILGTALIREFGGDDKAQGILLTMMCIAGVSLFCFWTTFATTTERIAPATTSGTVRGDIGELFRTGPWLVVALAAILGVSAIAARLASALFFFEYVAEDDGSTVLAFLDRPALFLTALAIGQVSGVIIGNLLQKHYEKHRIMMVAGLLKASAILIFYFVPLDAVWPQTLAQYFVGVGFGVLMIMSFAMFTDIAEYVDWKSGKQMTGLVVAASVFAVKAGTALGLAVPGAIMSITGFEAGEALNDTAKMGINIAFALFPALLLLPGVIALAFYRIDRRLIATIETELAQRRGQPA